MTRLPNAQRADVDIVKLRDYCLNPWHVDGKHKARAFRAALGIGRGDVEWLRRELLRAATTEPALVVERTRFGTLYMIDFLLTTQVGSAEIRSGWIIRVAEDFPRMTTCYVKRKSKS